MRTYVDAAVLALCAGLCLQPALPAGAAESFYDDFTDGLNRAWWRSGSNQPLYTVTPTNGTIVFTRPAGGTNGFQWVDVRLERELRGDFEVAARFTDASLDHRTAGAGNQVQLNVFFGTNLFAVVRSDENGLGGENVHVWADPPPGIRGTPLMTSASSGTLRVTRYGDVVAGYFNSTLLWWESFGTATVHLLSFSLQNNGTLDATRVALDVFTADAGDIRPFPCRFEGITPGAGGTVRLDVADVTPLLTNTLQESTDLGAGGWTVRQDFVAAGTASNATLTVTNASPAQFYRVITKEP